MISTAIDGAKSVAKLAQEYGKLDLYQQAVELMGKVTELAQENFELKKRVAELEQQIETKGKVVYHENAYWFGTKDQVQFHATDGPFCSRCFDVDGRLVRMHGQQLPRGRHFRSCPNCRLQRPT